MLGQREPSTYGAQTLADIIDQMNQQAALISVELSDFQSNAEHELIDKVHASLGSVDGILINPGAFTHTSIALRDALLSVNIPFVEVHLSNVYGREPFRHHSYLSDIAIGVISGFGATSYQLGLTALHQHLQHIRP
jgi:3-dehydroquinate dehydratase-2